MHREPKDDFILMHNILKYFLCRYAFFFQSTDPVNDLIVVIKYVVSLPNSKVSKTLS